jgi:chorismate mutase
MPEGTMSPHHRAPAVDSLPMPCSQDVPAEAPSSLAGETLDGLRHRIDALDAQIVRLLEERLRAAVEAGRRKREAGLPLDAPIREEQVLARVTGLASGPLRAPAARAIYREVLAAARRAQASAL